MVLFVNLNGNEKRVYIDVKWTYWKNIETTDLNRQPTEAFIFPLS